MPQSAIMKILLTLSLSLPLISGLVFYVPNFSDSSNAYAQNFKNYSNSFYSVRYPSKWIIDKSTTKEYLMLWSRLPSSNRTPGQSPLDLIKTDISVNRNVSFDSAVRNLGRSGGKKLSQQNVEINGIKAVQSFWSDLPFDFPNSISTIFQYGENEVVFATSYYDERNRSAKNNILQLHNSFRKY
jgi:hypothetical protein